MFDKLWTANRQDFIQSYAVNAVHPCLAVPVRLWARRVTTVEVIRMLKRKNRLGYFFMLPSMLFIVLLILYPVCSTIYTSFFDFRTQTWTQGMQFNGLNNYVRAINDAHFWTTVRWTLGFTSISVAFELFIGMLLALLMKQQLPGQGIIRTTVLIPWVIPTIVSGVLWKQFFNRSGIINHLLLSLGLIPEAVHWLDKIPTSRLALLVADIWKTTPYMALLLLSGMLMVSEYYYEAAKIDGAGRWQSFWHITLPMIKPAMMVALMFRIISALRVYDLIVSITSGGPAGGTETLSMYTINTYFTYGNLGYGSALAVIMLMIAMGISLFFVGSLKTKVVE